MLSKLSKTLPYSQICTSFYNDFWRYIGSRMIILKVVFITLLKYNLTNVMEHYELYFPEYCKPITLNLIQQNHFKKTFYCIWFCTV